MLIYLWVKSEPYGLASLKMHTGFRIKGTNSWQICFAFHWAHRVRNKIEQLLSAYCVQEIVLVIDVHDLTSSSQRSMQSAAFPTRGSSSAELRALMTCRKVGKVGKIWNPVGKSRPPVTALPPKVPWSWKRWNCKRGRELGACGSAGLLRLQRANCALSCSLVPAETEC